jgi:hypothetical protein
MSRPVSIVAERRRNNGRLLIRPADVIRCNPKAVTEIELGVMQLLNDSCFHVTTEANQLAPGMGRVFRALTCLLHYDFHVQIRDPAGMEIPFLVTPIFLAGARVKMLSILVMAPFYSSYSKSDCY